MSTRSRIGIQNKDGKITSIYCHHDGYVSYVGRMLVDHYKDENKIRKLLDLGDISTLGTEPIDNPRAWDMPKSGSFKELQKLNPINKCRTYAGRGEVCPAKTYTLKTTLKHFNNSDQEYLYIFKNGEWIYIERGETAKDFRSVKEELA